MREKAIDVVDECRGIILNVKPKESPGRGAEIIACIDSQNRNGGRTGCS